jgi:hypothetical protein
VDVARDSVLQQLDFIYAPSADPAADVARFTDVLGGRLIFAIEGMGTRVAMVELTSGPPRILLASHLHGERSILVYRVGDLHAAMKALQARGWTLGVTVELPMGPACSFSGPGGHRVAIYESSRPFVIESFEGRRDF